MVTFAKKNPKKNPSKKGGQSPPFLNILVMDYSTKLPIMS